ncbi:hypothetical protein [Streptomyces sp. G1]|uniref:hypothetical protein n=1 Tax=Streptomyces sp. G1 TaxID=361572 RepID=UPI00202F7628|nr:hypothetical protein [Streptomyces sp. G1]MCM1964913.1 hypothetical protein [Streptomyces sp. G1]
MTDQTPAVPGDEETPVTGPFRVSVTASPSGVDLDVSDFLRHVFLSLAEAAVEDPQTLIDTLTELRETSLAAAAPGTDAERARAGRERDEMTDELTDRHGGGGLIPVYGQQTVTLTERLWQLIRPRPVPQQRGEELGERGAA